ncbi:MAG: hypothetical protein KY410_10500, partial [Proteobacteria bacterium]|nr:hypothetical protein [Pseudomonadota bacterium]
MLESAFRVLVAELLSSRAMIPVGSIFRASRDHAFVWHNCAMKSSQRDNPHRGNYLERLRLRLAGRSALLQLCVLGLAVGF